MGIRKKILYMLSDERDLFFEALLKMNLEVSGQILPVSTTESEFNGDD